MILACNLHLFFIFKFIFNIYLYIHIFIINFIVLTILSNAMYIVLCLHVCAKYMYSYECTHVSILVRSEVDDRCLSQILSNPLTEEGSINVSKALLFHWSS